MTKTARWIRVLGLRGTGALLAALLAANSASAQASRNEEPASLKGIVPPKPTVTPQAHYPSGAEGHAQVSLIVEVSKEGRANRVQVESGAEPFASAAMKAVRAWRFSPAQRNGKVVPARIRVEIRFSPPVPEPPPPTPDTEADAPQEVVAQGQRSEIGVTVIPLEDARRIPGTFGDPLKVAEVQPGVALVASALPYYFVRGAPPGNVGYYFEGIRVPLLFHTGPGAPVINPAMVGSVELLATGYPARYGRHAGALMLGHAADPRPLARGEVQLRAFDASGYVEGPLSEGITLGVGGRHDYIQPILEQVSPQFELGYWDYQSRIHAQLDPKNSLSVLAFGASDRLDNVDTDTRLFDAEFHRVSLRWERRTESSEVSLSVALGQDRVATSVAVEEVSPDTQTSTAASLRQKSANVLFNAQYAASSALTLRGGVDYRLDRVEDEEVVGSQGDTFLAPARTDYSAGTYLDLLLQLADNFEIVPGIRLETGLWREASYLYLEPRLAWKVGLFDGVAWTSSMGIVNQLPTVAVRAPVIALSGLERDVQRAWQTSQDIDFVLPGSILGRVSGFFTAINAATEDIQSRTYGGELFLRRDLSERVGFVASYTLSKSTSTINGEDVPPEFDRRHVATASLGVDLGAGFRLGARGYYMTGQRYEARCPDADCSPAPMGTPTRYRVRGRLPDFVRADFRFEKRFDWDSGYWITLAAEWFNATLSREVFDATWQPETGLTEVRQDALTLPSLNLEGGF